MFSFLRFSFTSILSRVFSHRSILLYSLTSADIFPYVFYLSTYLFAPLLYYLLSFLPILILLHLIVLAFYLSIHLYMSVCICPSA